MPTFAKEYELLKISLASKHQFDREPYTNAKSELVNRITEIAKEEDGRC
ncbi:GrpB family protein [Emticicia sp. TH156]